MPTLDKLGRPRQKMSRWRVLSRRELLCRGRPDMSSGDSASSGKMQDSLRETRPRDEMQVARHARAPGVEGEEATRSTHAERTASDVDRALTPEFVPMSLATDAGTHGRGNRSVSAAVLQQMQRTY